LDNKRRFAFFSTEWHRRYPDQTDTYRDTRTGETFQVNDYAPCILGYPGWWKDGEIARPIAYETYVVVGEVGPGKLEFVKKSDEWTRARNRMLRNENRRLSRAAKRFEREKEEWAREEEKRRQAAVRRLQPEPGATRSNTLPKFRYPSRNEPGSST
jgi:hypothetical protein